MRLGDRSRERTGVHRVKVRVADAVVRQHLRAPAGSLLRSRRAHQGRRPARREGQPRAGRAARRQPGRSSRPAAGAALLVGNEIPSGAEPLALAYAGHQFGGFVPQLGDGRAILLGEVVGKDGQRRDIQLKGSGRTPFSRGGDGRAALGPVLREYLVSEAMAALGIPTTRALAVATTGERVMREEVLPGAVLTRVAASHLRVGTFEFFAARGDREALVALTAHALARHYPHAAGSGNDALALLERVIDAQANLVARWLGVGFVHGVMNTDNTAISGETLDYGPCAFLDEYDPNKKFSSIDHRRPLRLRRISRASRSGTWPASPRRCSALLVGRRGGGRPPRHGAPARASPPRFEAAHLRVLRAKLGLAHEDPADVDDRRPRARRRSARAARREPRRLHVVLPPPVRVRRRPVRRRRHPASVRRSRRLPHLGRDLAPPSRH